MRWGLFIPAVSVLFCACAQVGQLSGGEKDNTAPQLVHAEPAQYTTGFTGSRIVLEFDERITLDRVRDRMLVSPPLDPSPAVRISGAKSITIDLKGPLEPNTTYTLGIGEAIKDLTEGNFASGFRYVISTGVALDSMIVQGRVVNAFSAKPEEEILILAYAALDKVSIRKDRPAYATRSNSDGSFVLDHLRPGKYRLCALRDQNANFLFDLPNEEVAFLDEVVDLNPSDTLARYHELRLFQEVGPVQSIREVRVDPEGALRLAMARMAKDLDIRDVARTGGSLRWTSMWNERRDTVLLWPSDTTALRQGRYEVRVDGEILDTVRYRPVERMPFHTGLVVQVQEKDEGAAVVLRSSRPLEVIDTERITILQDSVLIPFEMERDSIDPRRFILLPELPEGSSGKLRVLPKAVRDIYGGYNDTLEVGIGRAAEKSMGTLELHVADEPDRRGPLIVRLMDTQDRKVRETYFDQASGSIKWTKLRPGAYSIVSILDLDRNGVWDTGDLDKGIQPEPVRYHPSTITIRSAWDLVVDLTVDGTQPSVDGQ